MYEGMNAFYLRIQEDISGFFLSIIDETTIDTSDTILFKFVKPCSSRAIVFFASYP